MKFVKSMNEDGAGNRSAYSKVEVNQKQYELDIGTDKKYTNISVRAHSVIMAASGKSKRIVGIATWDGKLDSKKKLLISSVKAASRKDRCRGLYGIDLNDGWQVVDVIVEITDSDKEEDDKDKVIKVISGSKKPYKEFFDSTGNLSIPELSKELSLSEVVDNNMEIVEVVQKKTKTKTTK